MVDWAHLLIHFAIAVLMLLVSLLYIKAWWGRASVILIQISLFVNSGVALAYNDVPGWFGWLHYLFLAAFLFAFIFFWRLSTSIARRVSSHASLLDRVYSNHRLVLWVLVAYFASLLLGFVYPDMRINALFKLKPPDLRAVFFERFETSSPTPFGALAHYIRILVFPFFLVSLYQFRRSPIVLGLIVSAALYIQYADRQYIARGTIMMFVLSVGLFYFYLLPRYRLRLVLVSASLVPALFVFFDYWMVVRLGGTYEYVAVIDAVERIVSMQTGFVRAAGLPLIQSGQHVDLGAYFAWIATLPFPKFIIGEVAGARVNYEISEIVLGVSRGLPGFFVILPGVVAESVYIFGLTFFWLHAIFFGAFSAIIIRFFAAFSGFGFLTAWLVVFFAYKMPGAGVGAVLPSFVNELLLLYLFNFYLIFLRKNKENYEQLERRVGAIRRFE